VGGRILPNGEPIHGTWGDTLVVTKEDHLRKTGSSRLPVECSLVSFLGSKLKKLWKISLHWLICIKNLLLHPMTDEHRDVILSIQ
jgi:hypothetical protein